MADKRKRVSTEIIFASHGREVDLLVREFAAKHCLDVWKIDVRNRVAVSPSRKIIWRPIEQDAARFVQGIQAIITITDECSRQYYPGPKLAQLRDLQDHYNSRFCHE